MRRHIRRLADKLTALRLLLVPPLWILALLGLRLPLGIGVAFAGLTDVIDGPIARHEGRTTRFGSQLDSIADHTLTASTIAWLFMFRPDFFREYGRVMAVWLGFALFTLAFGYLRFRRIADLHLYSAKAAGFVGYLFAIWMLATDRPAAPFFHVAIALAFLATAETFLVLITRANVDEHVRSVLIRRRPRGTD